MTTPRTRFEDMVTEFNDAEGVTPPRGGSGFGRGALVLKLPAPRVDELVRARQAAAGV